MERQVQIKNLKGIHARAAAKIVKVAEQFNATVTLSYNGATVSALSIMGLMLLSARLGVHVTLSAQGPQASQALDALTTLIEQKFDEE
jgi:phosphocarrier protein HPr